MSCDEIRAVLDDYAADRLAGRWRARTETHLAACPGCSRELEEIRELRSGVERLRREIEPQRDLWPAIAGRLRQEAARRADSAAAWRSAAAVALLLGGSLIGALLGSGAPPAKELGATAAGRGGPALHLRQQDGALHVYRDLLGAVELRRGGLDAIATAALDAALVDLERAVAEIGRALELHPDDPVLRRMLAHAYRRESGWTRRLQSL